MNLSQLRQDANRRLHEDGDGFSRLILIHSAVTAGVSVLLMLVNWLSQYMATEGGLSNFDTQSLLSTGQILLQMIAMIAVPFWDAGLIYCSMQLTQGKRSSVNDLTEGFRRWSPIASSLGIRALIYFMVSTVCSFAASLFFSALPLPTSVINDLSAFMESPTFPLSSGVRIFLAAYSLIYLLGLCVLLIPRLYLHRQVAYRIMDNTPCTGLQSVLHSRILMKGHRRELLLLDLSFWWFYLLELCVIVFSLGNLLLQELGILLPIGPDVAAWVFPIIALLAQLVLYYFAKPKLSLSYALFYKRVFEESLREPEPPKPQKMPWKY